MNEYRPRPDDRLVEPLFDGLEVVADTEAGPEHARLKAPWPFVVLLAVALGAWLWIEFS
jgi:hypothetical protein